MNVASAEMTHRPSLVLSKAALIGGLLCGAIDLLYAFAFWGFKGVSPVRILQSIATGWLGRASFDGGAASAALGAVSHFGILIVAAAMFVAAARHWRVLIDRALLAGFAFGACIWIVMNYVVLPLSAAPQPPPGAFFTLASVTNILVHVFLLGPAITLVAARQLRKSVV